MQGTGTGRRHTEVRRHASIRIDLQRRKRENRTFDVCFRRALERGVEEAGIRRHLLDVFVGRHDEDCDSGRRARGNRRRQGFCGRRQASDDLGRSIE